jgi:hypothetical protein
MNVRDLYLQLVSRAARRALGGERVNKSDQDRVAAERWLAKSLGEVFRRDMQSRARLASAEQRASANLTLAVTFFGLLAASWQGVALWALPK